MEGHCLVRLPSGQGHQRVLWRRCGAVLCLDVTLHQVAPGARRSGLVHLVYETGRLVNSVF